MVQCGAHSRVCEYLFQALGGLAIVNSINKMSPAASWANEKALAIQSFEKCMAAKNRMLITLSAVFFTYYFTFIIGAGWFRDIYVLPLMGGVNVGTAFALSQYFFVAGLALIYAYRMRRIDAQIKVFADTWRTVHEHC
jgi:uncharacterized membrane protein (DUF485 family)